MFGIGGSVRIYYCPTPINLRKSFDGLAGAVEEYIKQDPESGHVFAFFSRNKKLVKLLQWEDGGFVIWMKVSAQPAPSRFESDSVVCSSTNRNNGRTAWDAKDEIIGRSNCPNIGTAA